MSNHKWLILVALLFVALTAARAGSQGFSGELDLSPSRYVTPPPPTPPEDGEFPKVERKELVNEYDGFKIQYPEGWQTEIIPGVVTVLTCPGAKLSIFVQPLGKITAEEYILYSNRSLQEGWGTIRLLQQKKLRIKGYPAWQFDWTRDKIAAGDLNYYREYHIIVAHTVYTFMLKTGADNFEAAAEELSRMLVTWRPIAAKGPPSFPEPPRVERRVELEGENHRLVIPADKMLWGILNPHKLGRLEYFRQLLPLEQKLDYKFEFLITYAAFDTHFSPEELRKIYNDGRILMVALQPWWYGKRDDTSLIDLLKGKYDGIFREWARQFKALGDPVFVRFGNEMNGDWSTWSAWFYGKDTDIFKMAWQHVYRLFKEEGADNVVFVFNPHDRSFPNFKWNNYLLYYPGDDTVDWIGLTGYNNGTSHAADVWREFEAIYEPLYREYMYYFGDKPFIITEFASNEVGGNKANWIKRAMESLARDYPNIKIAVWFNQIDGQWLYNLDSSPESFRAFKEGLKNPRYQFRAVWPRQK